MAGPPRVNCAGRCVVCGERDCQTQACVDYHAVCLWAVCDVCDGAGWANGWPCVCTSGVVEVGR
ncbi:hypothetical protein OHA72_21970 [Dactylosporangium sp. NBC_01737]|uniref:hypothetical protein n=1 Tax=Dactylosporangium sp. NBC_01737 TaxID=2975959 RepID=UPI002E16656A|nr:hypothetical protein OHA72_21970 [Dactylosporangium sp. NBC_01737]